MHGNVTRTLQKTQHPLLTLDKYLRMTSPKKDAEDKITKSGNMIIYVAAYSVV